MPEWLNDERVDLSGVRNLVKQVQTNDGNNKNKLKFIAQKFSDEFIKALVSFSPEQGADFGEKLLVQIDAAKLLRDLYFDYVESLIVCDLDVGAVIGDFFEQVYNGTYRIDGHNSYNDTDFEFSKFLIWEMFIGSAAILLHYENYRELNSMLHRTYFLRGSPISQNIEPNTFIHFRPAHRYIDEHIKPKSENPRLFTLAGDIVVKREKLPIITKSTLANADLVLYQLSTVFDDSSNPSLWYWFPVLYVYAGNSYSYNQILWSKLVSLKHCQKLFPLFGVTQLAQLIKIVEKSVPNRDYRYSGAYDSAPSIQQSIDLSKIGTLP
jgi:hypothetical protein